MEETSAYAQGVLRCVLSVPLSAVGDELQLSLQEEQTTL